MTISQRLLIGIGLVFISVQVLGFKQSHQTADDELKVGEWILLGARYTSIVTFKELEAAPKWRIKDANPPISARKAIEIAREMLANKLDFVHKERFTWDPKEALLFRTDSSDEGETWHWRIVFEEGWHGLSGPPQRIEATVLMNGRAVVPIITKVKPEDHDAE